MFNSIDSGSVTSYFNGGGAPFKYICESVLPLLIRFYSVCVWWGKGGGAEL
jgi:hypothetical protein